MSQAARVVFVWKQRSIEGGLRITSRAVLDSRLKANGPRGADPGNRLLRCIVARFVSFNHLGSGCLASEHMKGKSHD